jgi:hypothetical protein
VAHGQVCGPALQLSPVSVIPPKLTDCPYTDVANLQQLAASLNNTSKSFRVLCDVTTVSRLQMFWDMTPYSLIYRYKLSTESANKMQQILMIG